MNTRELTTFVLFSLLPMQPVPNIIETIAAVVAKGQTSLNAMVYVLGHERFYKLICAIFCRKEVMVSAVLKLLTLG